MVKPTDVLQCENNVCECTPNYHLAVMTTNICVRPYEMYTSIHWIEGKDAYAYFCNAIDLEMYALVENDTRLCVTK